MAASPTSSSELGLLKTRLQASGTCIIDDKDLEWHDQLGRGKYGKVYRVTWHRQREDGSIEDIEAAAKVTTDGDPNEVEKLMQMKHDHIIDYYGVVIKEPTLILVMQYAPKGSLMEYLQDFSEMIPLPQVLSWCKNLALAVQYLHNNDFVHRDIKANNCLIFEDMTLKLCDFGGARVLNVTVSTNERGTCQWMAPEVIKERVFSKKSDVYSLAIVFWQILACKPVPYPDLESQQVLWQVCANKRRPEIPPECPDSFRALLTDCWESDRSKRPDINQVLTILGQIENDHA